MLRFLIVTLLFISNFTFLIECSDDGPLILTPLLEAGKYKEAQKEALLVPAIQGVKSFTGFFTVNKSCDSNLFFWFTPSEKDWESAPVVLWLNGGPGCTSLFGLFREIGPLDFDPKNKFTKRDQYWSQEHNVLYLDQPAGSGFSYTTKKCYAKDMETVGQEAYQALVQFFMLFPNLQKNRFFITGESFSGHYIPALALEIDEQNKKAKSKINLVGVMMGNPALDDRCTHLAPFLYQLGIVDEKTRDSLSKLETELHAEITKGDATQSFKAGAKVNDMVASTGLPSPYNVLYDHPMVSKYQLYVRRYDIRKTLHVGLTPFNSCSDEVYTSLSYDFYSPVNSNLQKLLRTDKYTVGTYSGHLDLQCMYHQVPCVLRQLKWSGAADYIAANRSQWYVGDRLAGWYKTAGNVFQVVVRDSGHFVPYDQPAALLDLLKAFVGDTAGSRLLTKLKTESA